LTQSLITRGNLIGIEPATMDTQTERLFSSRSIEYFVCSLLFARRVYGFETSRQTLVVTCPHMTYAPHQRSSQAITIASILYNHILKGALNNTQLSYFLAYHGPNYLQRRFISSSLLLSLPTGVHLSSHFEDIVSTL
jgi:hypothetical protein